MWRRRREQQQNINKKKIKNKKKKYTEGTHDQKNIFHYSNYSLNVFKIGEK